MDILYLEVCLHCYLHVLRPRPARARLCKARLAQSILPLLLGLFVCQAAPRRPFLELHLSSTSLESSVSRLASRREIVVCPTLRPFLSL